jgi:general secretion pathway protein E
MNLAEPMPLDPARTFTQEEIAAARSEAARGGRRVLAVLEEQSCLPPSGFLVTLATTFHYQPMALDVLSTLEPAFDVLSYTESVARECVAFRGTGGALLVVLTDPFDLDLRAWAEERTGGPLGWGMAHRSDLLAVLARYEDSVQAMDAALRGAAGTASQAVHVDDLSLRTIAADASPAVRLVHSTIYDALKAQASDVHLECLANGLVIKYRIDGVLTLVGTADSVALAEQVISRIKVMAELDIAERRVPQDGRFKISVKGREIDFRVSIMPSIFGEDAVLRVLDKQSLTDAMRGLRLDYLGFHEDTNTLLRRLASEPYGMLLVTGPTGSGKTTTLYALITEINSGQDKIVTIEDPVEYQLPGVLQIPVNDKKGLTFARGLRSILRHDPDKIMVGEIRDQETAHIAVQSALTGHLVFTTVHANNVFDVIGRFMHMQVDPYSFVSALNGIVAQRLVRMSCPHCVQAEKPGAALLADSGLTEATAKAYKFRKGSGCGACRGAGYKGRKAIAEVLVLNDEVRELIVERAPIRRLKEVAARHGMKSLRQAALDLVRRGETDLAEINRVTFVG